MGFFCVGLIWLFSALQKQRSLAGRKTQAAVYETGA